MLALGALLLLGPSGLAARPLLNPGLRGPVVPTERPAIAEVLHLAATAGPDTNWYGGTVWAADSNRWEAIPDGIWTFESGVGSSIQNAMPEQQKPNGYHRQMEGWLGHVRGNELPDIGFRRATDCVITGDYSLWAGRTQAEAEASCWPGGRGYGNGINAVVERTFAYPGAGNVTLEFDFAVDSEPGFDYLSLTVQPSGAASPVVLNSWNGMTTGHAVFTLRTIDGTLPAGAGTVTIRFIADSDGAYSDEDGLYLTSCGHSAIDNIQLTGAIVHTATFESSTDGWDAVVPATPPVEDFSSLDDVDDLPPPAGFTGRCGTSDSVLVFINPAGQHPAGQSNVAGSPWIDLRAGGDVGRPGMIVRFDAYSGTNTSVTPNLAWGVQYYPWTCPVTGEVGVSPPIFNGFFFFFGAPSCGPVTYNLRNLVPTSAEQLRVFLGPHPYGSFNTNAGPWIDNVRVAVFGGATSGTEPAPAKPTYLTEARPNPASGATRIVFGVARNNTPTRIEIFDIAGRRVRTLLDRSLDAGSHEIVWDGRAEDGSEVVAGLYFYHYESGSLSETRKLVVVR
ncbi:MAG: FlgD immunoglobulin-like domain containing protein [Candidatus Eisenbacteria bacterium]|nr:FlgD immunoglobulin-like domain containing protein [Candidatus Eisenbacteria bacterium]